MLSPTNGAAAPKDAGGTQGGGSSNDELYKFLLDIVKDSSSKLDGALKTAKGNKNEETKMDVQRANDEKKDSTSFATNLMKSIADMSAAVTQNTK
jgi:hypothetical protein